MVTGVPTVVQYHAAGSSSYFAVGCREASGAPCARVAYYNAMFTRDAGALGTGWGEPTPMQLQGDFEWTALVRVPSGAGVALRWLVAVDADGSAKFGTMMDIAVQRSAEAAGHWAPGATTSMASGATWAVPVRVDACCTLQAQQLIPGQAGVWQSLSPCEELQAEYTYIHTYCASYVHFALRTYSSSS